MNTKITKFILKYLVTYPFKGILFIIGILLFFMLKILRPLIHIRVGHLYYRRIGTFSKCTEAYLRQRTRNKAAVRERHIFFSGEPANYQLLKMMQRQMLVIKNQWIASMYETIHRFIRDSDLWIVLPKDNHSAYEVADIPPQLTFTPQEEIKGKQLLKGIGIESRDPFVCFYVRDSAYLDKMHVYRSRKDWSYHDCRNCNVDTFLPSVNYLSLLEIVTLRMGYIVEQALQTDNPRIIDYATRYRSDFGDSYLSARCKFFLTSDGGLNSVPWIFNTPVAYCNCFDPLHPAWGKRDIFMPNKLWLIEEKRFLTFREIVKLGTFGSGRALKQAGVEIVKNTPDEILGLTKEMNARLDGTWVTSTEDEELQKRYRAIFPEGHQFYGFPSRISAEFLRQNQALME